VFCALVVTEKRSVDELFMHYFHNLSPTYRGKGAQTPTGALSLDPLGYFVPRPIICPPLKKNPAGAQADPMARQIGPCSAVLKNEMGGEKVSFEL